MKYASRIAVGLTMLVFFVGPLLAQPDIVHMRSQANKKRIVVVNSDGSNSQQIFVGPEFAPYTDSPSISPGGEWVAFRGLDDDGRGPGIYKIDSQGSGLTKVLCSEGATVGGVPFEYPGRPQWSQDGKWILVTGAGTIALVSADDDAGLGAAGSACAMELIPIYLEDLDHEPGATGNWDVEGSAAWSHDGGQIAFLEKEWVIDDQTGDSHSVNTELVLINVVLGTLPTVVGVTRIPVDHNLDAPFPFALDRQRQGDFLSFSTWHGSHPDAFASLNWIYVGSDPFLQPGSWGTFGQGFGPSWSPDDSQIVFDEDDTITVADVIYDNDGIPIAVDVVRLLGEGSDPDWQRNPFEISCVDQPQICDDGQECTVDSCELIGDVYECWNTALSGPSCGEGGQGYCSDGICLGCGNGICEAGECTTCPDDCLILGGETCGDGICEWPETWELESCPADCASGPGFGPACGNGLCEYDGGEDCRNCPADCAGRLKGKPSRQFCCGEDTPCTDSRCRAFGNSCTDYPTGPFYCPGGDCSDPRCSADGLICSQQSYPTSCCGDGICEGYESDQICESDFDSTGAATLVVSYSYDATDEVLFGDAVLIPGEKVVLYDEIFPGNQYPDVAECRSTCGGQIQAYYHDALSGPNPGTVRPLVSSGCSRATDHGFWAECCHAP